MNFDLRLPLGIIFTLFGAMLTITGAVNGAGAASQSLGINVNLDWGLVVFLFGGWMLFLALRARAKRKH